LAYNAYVIVKPYRDHVEVMLVFEFKAYGKRQQFDAVDEAIRTVQFIRNKAIRLWMAGDKIDKNDLSKYCAVLAKEFPFCDNLNCSGLDRQVRKGRGRRFPDSTTIARRKLPAKRDFHSSRKTTAQSNTRLAVGSWQQTGSLSLSPTNRGLGS